jgi:hypothetical protein
MLLGFRNDIPVERRLEELSEAGRDAREQLLEIAIASFNDKDSLA